MDKQSFYDAIREKMSSLGAGEDAISGSLRKFEKYFSQMTDEEIENTIKNLGNTDELAVNLYNISRRTVKNPVRTEGEVKKSQSRTDKTSGEMSETAGEEIHVAQNDSAESASAEEKSEDASSSDVKTEASPESKAENAEIGSVKTETDGELTSASPDGKADENIKNTDERGDFRRRPVKKRADTEPDSEQTRVFACAEGREHPAEPAEPVYRRSVRSSVSHPPVSSQGSSGTDGQGQFGYAGDSYSSQHDSRVRRTGGNYSGAEGNSSRVEHIKPYAQPLPKKAAANERRNAAPSTVIAYPEGEVDQPISFKDIDAGYREPKGNALLFWVLFAVTLPLTAALALAVCALFAAAFFAGAALIIASIGVLIALVAGGTGLSLFGIVYGITQLFSSVPEGLYELGLGIIIGGCAMFIGILVYNFAIRLLPFALKYLFVFFRFVVRQAKRLFIFIKKECVG